MFIKAIHLLDKEANSALQQAILKQIDRNKEAGERNDVLVAADQSELSWAICRRLRKGVGLTLPNRTGRERLWGKFNVPETDVFE